MIKSKEKLEGGALMRGIAVLGLALLAAGSLPAATVAIGQLQLTNSNGYQALTFYNFTGVGNGGCDGVEYEVCNGITIRSWSVTLTYTNTGNSNPTNAPPPSKVTFTSGASDAIAPYSVSGAGYTGSLSGTWEIPLTGAGGTEPACPPCDYQLTQVELSGTIDPANLPFTVGSPGSTSQFGANPNFDTIWAVQSSDSSKPGFVDYSSPQFFGGQYDVVATDQQSTPFLFVTKTHTGNFTPGQTGATYAVTVSNAAGAVATSGTVTVTETVPSGLTLVSMAGTGWTCPGGTTCTRSDVLAGGASYAPITVTVNVAANATSPQVNAVSVSGGGSASANATDSTTISANVITYLVGDVAPYTADTAPAFGDGILNILDLIQELFAVNNVPGFQPAACSDRFDAMDLYPVDAGVTRGGDGVLDIRDLIHELFRVNNLELDRPVRATRGGVCAGAGNSISASPIEASRSTGLLPRPRAGVQGALVLGDPEKSSEAEERVPVYLEAGRDLVRVAVTFALGDQRSQLRFVPTAETPPSLVQYSQPGVVAVAWLEGMSVRAGERLLLGYVVGPAGATANLKVYGMSASGLDDNREVRLGPQRLATTR